MTSMTNPIVRVVFFCLCCTLLPSADAQTTPVPKLEGESFSGRKVVLPDDASGKVAVLVFGFTKASKGQTSDWARKLSADLRARAEVYQLPVLEDVPRFIRGMVISSIKKGVPENERDHFVPVLQGEAELKKFVNYKESDDAYLAVLDRSGKVVQQMHGALTDSAYSSLRTQLEASLNQK